MIVPADILSISGCSAAWTVIRPQVFVKVVFLYVPDHIAIDFVITSFRIGRNEMFGNIGEVPATLFSMVSEERWCGPLVEEFRKTGKMPALMEALKITNTEIAGPHKDISVHVRNLNPSARNFHCAVLGDEVTQEAAMMPRKPVVAETQKTVKATSETTSQPKCYGCDTKPVPVRGELCNTCRL